MITLYRHIRLDKNEVFYIGIGDEKRPYSKRFRNRYWHNIVSNTDYRVDILFDDLTWSDACEKEKEFIALYGRKDLGKGTLCNLTDGGEGGFGLVFSEETRKKISEARKGQSPSETTRKKISEAQKGKTHSQETKEKMSEARKGQFLSEEIRKKISQAKKGKKPSNEAVEKNRQAHLGEKNHFFGKKHTQEVIEKNRASHIGKKHSEETKEKMSRSSKGKTHSDETKEKMRQAHLKRKKITE